MILLMLLFSNLERNVNASSLLSLFFRLSMSRRDKAFAILSTFSLPGDTHILFHFLQRVKASITAKRCLKVLTNLRYHCNCLLSL
jgi:hypothetical protein